jgi:hypothetical protein
MHSDEAHRRAEALFRKAQHVRKGEQGMAEYQAKLDAMRKKPRACERCVWLVTPQPRTPCRPLVARFNQFERI